MPMTAARRFFRYLVLALAATQIVASAGAPVLEARLAAAHVSNAVTEQSGAPHGIPAHDPSTCAVCQLLSSVAPPPQAPLILAPRDDVSGRVVVAIDQPRQQFRRTGVLSRAPPTLPA
jgi:hypothetical protein